MKIISCSTQLSMKFFLLINVEMPIIVGILTFMSRKNSILGLSEAETVAFLDILYLYAFKILCSAALTMNLFITSWPVRKHELFGHFCLNISGI